MQEEILSALRNGQNFSVATAATSMVLTLGGHQRMILANPSGSLSNFFVYKMVFSSNGINPTSVKVFPGPTTVIAGADATVAPLRLGDIVSGDLLSLKSDTSTSAMAGTGLNFPAPNTGATSILDTPFLLPPNNSVGFDFTYGTAAGLTLNSYVMFYYFRESL